MVTVLCSIFIKKDTDKPLLDNVSGALLPFITGSLEK
jgi:hypothetical protein